MANSGNLKYEQAAALYKAIKERRKMTSHNAQVPNYLGGGMSVGASSQTAYSPIYQSGSWTGIGPTGVATTNTTATTATSNYGSYITVASTTPITNITQTMAQAQYSHALQQAYGLTGGWTKIYAATPPHSPTSLKSEGVRVGEIIAWRAWRWWDHRSELPNYNVERDCTEYVHMPCLLSVVTHSRWEHDTPMEGDPTGGWGIHAYKTPLGPMKDEYVSRGSHGWVVGRVALWGEIIEHEDGYRAQYGKIVSLDDWCVSVTKRQIAYFRKLYKLDKDDGKPSVE